VKPICIVQNWAPESPGNLADYLKDKSIPYNVVRSYKGEALPEMSSLEAAIVLGSPTSFRDYKQHDYLKRLFTFVAEAVRANLPLLAICFGSQMLARVLGAEVVRNDVREMGIYKIGLTEEGQRDRLFAGLGSELQVFPWNTDTFKVTCGATLLATGDTCTNQAFRKNNAVGILFHPEPRTDEIPLWCDAHPEELIEEGLTKDEIVAGYNVKAEQMKQLSYRLMQNFLG
jgi:GMP synthase-like glutamine amidotransferase